MLSVNLEIKEALAGNRLRTWAVTRGIITKIPHLATLRKMTFSPKGSTRLVSLYLSQKLQLFLSNSKCKYIYLVYLKIQTVLLLHRRYINSQMPRHSQLLA
jgi:hypothetical protein